MFCTEMKGGSKTPTRFGKMFQRWPKKHKIVAKLKMHEK